MTMALLSLEIRLEPDVVLARQRARQIAALLGFPPLDQTRIATATSEVARYAFEFAGGGKAEFLVKSGPPAGLLIRVRERGPGIPNLQAVLEGQYASPTGSGAWLLGAKRLMDRFEVEAPPGLGATVTMSKGLPRRSSPITSQDVAKISVELARQAPRGLLDELAQQNQEFLRTLQELRDHQAELAQIHARELDETNRGVVALYAELDEDAKTLRRISELKSRFLSNMSHEFRSPLNTILSLSGFLLDRSDGELTREQEKQVLYIRKAAEGVAALVNDLLDLAKVEAGKAVVRVDSFQVDDLFEAMRGTTEPLLGPKPVALVFETPAGVSTLRNDEGKIAQILRNFLSNAVKFTESGEIRVAATEGPGDMVTFSVADTGIGIAPGDWGRVFEEFGQVENPLQGRVKSTGLGLPLSKKLAELLGGTVSLRSEPGVGSTFYAVVPRDYDAFAHQEPSHETRGRVDPRRPPLLVVESDPIDLLVYERHLKGSGFPILSARNLDEARAILRRVRPMAVFLDADLEAGSGWTFLAEVRSREETKDLPVFVLALVDSREQALASGADEFCLKPLKPSWLVAKLRQIETRGRLEMILIIDDEESHRYVLKDLLSSHGGFVIIEASNGAEGLRLARDGRPDAIFLDLTLRDMTGFEVLEQLKSDPATNSIPVIINTSKTLEDEELQRLTAGTAAVLSKGPGSRADLFAMIRDALTKAGLGMASPAAEA